MTETKGREMLTLQRTEGYKESQTDESVFTAQEEIAATTQETVGSVLLGWKEMLESLHYRKGV